MLKLIVICLLAGVGAGLTTGFAGLSAAVFITPMLTVFLGTSFYDAVGISLASDVLASALSAAAYSKNGNIDLINSRMLMVSVWVSAVIGSLIARLISSGETGNTVLSWWSILAAFFVGADLILRAKKKREKSALHYSGKRKFAILLCGLYIGFVCGFQGTGGGMMLLLVLTLVMNFEFKNAVGTSVFIMAFTAFIGAVSHFAMNGMPETGSLVLCVVFTALFARIGAVLANRLPAVRAKYITGLLLVVSAGVMFLARLTGAGS